MTWGGWNGTIDQVFDGPGVERLPRLTVYEFTSTPAEQTPDARLERAVCLRLLSLKYPVNDYNAAFRAGEDPPIPDPQETFAASTRHDNIACRFALSKPQFELLSALVEDQTVGAAITQYATFFTDLAPVCRIGSAIGPPTASLITFTRLTNRR